MSKRFKIILLSAVSTLLALFIVMLFLAVPMGAKRAVLPLPAFYITALATAGVFLLAGLLCVICLKSQDILLKKFQNDQEKIK